MADNAPSSGYPRSKNRRRSARNNNNSRRGRQRSRNNNNNSDDCDAVQTRVSPVIDVTDSDRLDHSERLRDKEESANYRVESPVTVPKQTRKGSVTKSRSLDDDDQVKIQELSECSDTETHLQQQCNNAIVVEAESEDIEWEITKDLIIQKTKEEHVVRTMTTETLKLEEKIPPKVITPEDESHLRYFLEGLNLASSPEEAAIRRTQESADVIRAKRAKKREELAQYFLPVYQNPRFLDVISEEGSDHSDRETRERKEWPRSNQTKKTILTEIADSVRVPLISDTCTTSLAETGVASDVEVVYLDTSDSDQDGSSDYADDEDVISPQDVQLTPPPTPNEVSPKNEPDITGLVKEIASLISDENYEKLRRILKDPRYKYLPSDLQIKINQLSVTDDLPKPGNRLNVISPSVLSDCSGDSSSRGTSLCTTIFKEEEDQVLLSLRELCLRKVISLPHGPDILEELASVSRSLEELTNKLSCRMHAVDYNHSHHASNPDNRLLLTEARIPSNTNDFDLVSAKTAMPERPKDMRRGEKWVGIPTEEDPNLVVCLSPTQKTFLDTTRKIPDEAKKLLDLHEKFAERRGYYEDDAGGDASNRLLAIIREERSDKSGKRLPRSNSLDDESARLQARNLSEWLRLARDKSKSDTNLNISEKEDGQNRRIAEKRRKSLPHEIYVQQMQYLIQKEKEIQFELEKLEEEKRKLTTEMRPEFDASKYRISKNEDIAIHNDELHLDRSRITSKLAPSTERFRQEMYDEYMVQIAKRHDRQQHKVIKISSHQIQDSNPNKDKMKGLEDEFMSKVKQRKQKYGLNSEDDYTSFEKSDAEDSEPVLVMDGDHVSQAKKLPKHLKEFVDMTRQAAGALDEDGAEDGELRTKRLGLQWMLCYLLNVLNKDCRLKF